MRKQNGCLQVRYEALKKYNPQFIVREMFCSDYATQTRKMAHILKYRFSTLPSPSMSHRDVQQVPF